MKQKFKNNLKLVTLLLGLSILLINCETENISDIEIPQIDYLQSAKYWFNNNPELNNYSLLDYTERINWSLAKSFNNESSIAVEIPIILKQNISLTSNKSNISTNRIVILKSNDEYSSFIINISTSENNLEFINDLTKINYFNIPQDFTGNILIIKSNTKGASLNSIVKGKEKIKTNNISSKEASICYEIVELFDDGSVRHTGIIFCVEGGGGSSGTDYPYHGSGGNNSASNQFLNQDVWDTQGPYDDWNELTDCEKDFFRSNLDFIAQAISNKGKAQNAALVRFGDCINTNGHPLHNTIGDAYRHAYFSALNAQNSSFGYANAKKLGDAHECNTPIDKLNEKQMDLHNNAWGYSYASNNQYFTEAMFYSQFINAKNNGEIEIIQNCI